jgi:phosphoglycolate phosphatase-like HAD superfamily hydrolase
MHTARLVWLFDVDGTLISTDGAAREAFARTVRDRLGVEDDLKDIPFAGRTDPLILGDILAKHGVTLGDGAIDQFWRATHAEMGALLAPGRGRVLPGVVEVLDAVAAEPAWVSALLTGNTAGMARVKLGHYGLADRFAFGAFGDEAPDRNSLACIAVDRASRYGVPPGRCIVVGDTEHDVACARAAGARVVAVATGVSPRAELALHQPDLLLEDLTDAAGLVAWARKIESAG